MSTWNDVDEDLPSVDEIVEVWLDFGQGGVTRLRGYRLAGPAGAETLWLNALTHEPFPEGWRVVRWRKAEGESAVRGAAPPAGQVHKPT
ncbi:MAG TPA: hypothetical protein VN730_11360 [Steroidobacteraceae bacterium]|nr:hypothetical protein [Steroidobacteraceae bacterium]